MNVNTVTAFSYTDLKGRDSLFFPTKRIEVINAHDNNAAFVQKQDDIDAKFKLKENIADISEVAASEFEKALSNNQQQKVGSTIQRFQVFNPSPYKRFEAMMQHIFTSNQSNM